MRYLKERRESGAIFDYERNQWYSQFHNFPHGKKFKFRCNDGTTKVFDFVSEFHEGFAAVELNGKMGFIDKKGKEICPIKYKLIRKPGKRHTLSYSVFSDGYAFVAKTSEDGRTVKYGYINTEGREISPFIYSKLFYEKHGSFHNGVAVVKKIENTKYVVINKKFEEISKEYEKIEEFIFGFARVEVNGKFGYIDETGKEICEPKFDYAAPFHKDGLANAGCKDRHQHTQLIDKNGKEYYLEDDGILYPYDESNPIKYRCIFPDGYTIV